jgi:hypothetical protein
MIIKRTDGKEIDTDCEYFADENVDNNYVKEHCFVLGTNIPKCPLWIDCFSIYTRRREG